MKTQLTKSNHWQLTLAVVVIILAFLGLTIVQSGVALADSPSADAMYSAHEAKEPKIFPPDSKPFGKSYREWNAEWWKWAYSMPVDQHPLFDTADCSERQPAKVWFLGGAFNAATATRNCTVPGDKALFFPILNIECATLEGNGATEKELRACTKSLMKLATDLAAEIDGISVKHLEKYRVGSTSFTYGPLPENNVPLYNGYDAPAGATSLAAADGYYLMLAPLSKGKHTIHFTGRLLGEYGGSPIDFTLDITYHLTVGK